MSLVTRRLIGLADQKRENHTQLGGRLQALATRSRAGRAGGPSVVADVLPYALSARSASHSS